MKKQAVWGRYIAPTDSSVLNMNMNMNDSVYRVLSSPLQNRADHHGRTPLQSANKGWGGPRDRQV